MELTPLITEEQIRKRVAELGEAITRDSNGEPLVVICVLKGSFIFMADLVRHISVPLEVDFLRVSSYGTGTQSSGFVRFEADTKIDLKDRHVLLVEDIVDSGLTLARILDTLGARKPASLRTVSLLCKSHVIPDIRARIQYVGFDIGSEFVVGYGLDYAERFRELPQISLIRGLEN